MIDSKQMDTLTKEISELTKKIFPAEKPDIILFGSYARGEAGDDSDVDFMILISAPRDVISEHSWEIGEAAAELLLKYDVVVSPIVENRDYFNKNSNVLPFYKNIIREGVRISA